MAKIKDLFKGEKIKVRLDTWSPDAWFEVHFLDSLNVAYGLMNDAAGNYYNDEIEDFELYQEPRQNAGLRVYASRAAGIDPPILINLSLSTYKPAGYFDVTYELCQILNKEWRDKSDAL